MHKNESGIAHIALIAVALVVIVGATGAYVYKVNNKSQNSERSTAATSLNEPLPTVLSVEEVKKLAAVDAPSTGLSTVELEKEEGVYVYKVTLANGNVLLFNAQTGAKITKAAEKKEADNETIATDFKPTITYDKAREIALAKKPNGTITKIQLEAEEGKTVYSVRFSDSGRVDVDATTGAIVKYVTGKTTTAQPAPSSTNTSPSPSSGSGSSGSSSSSGSTKTSSDDSKDDDKSGSNSGSGSSGSSGGSGSGSSGSGSSRDDD